MFWCAGSLNIVRTQIVVATHNGLLETYEDVSTEGKRTGSMADLTHFEKRCPITHSHVLTLNNLNPHAAELYYLR